MLEEEVYSQNSPIWDQDFLSASSRTSQLGIQTGKKKEKKFFFFWHKSEHNQEVFVAVHCAFICIFHQEIEDYSQQRKVNTLANLASTSLFLRRKGARQTAKTAAAAALPQGLLSLPCTAVQRAKHPVLRSAGRRRLFKDRVSVTACPAGTSQSGL